MFENFRAEMARWQIKRRLKAAFRRKRKPAKPWSTRAIKLMESFDADAPEYSGCKTEKEPPCRHGK